MPRPLRTLRCAPLVASLLPRGGALALLAGVMAGCSLIGLTIGRKVDSAHVKLVPVDGWDFARIAPDARLRVHFRDGGQTEGVFRGLDISPSEYRARYERWREARTEAGPRLPMIGDAVTLQGGAGKRWSARFLGFEYASLATSRDGHAEASLVPYHTLAQVSTADGTVWEGAQLTELASAGRLPLRSRLLLDKADVPLERVERLETWRQGHTGELLGFVIGAIVDTVLIVAIVQSSSTPSSLPTGYSCPWVYSFDGQHYAKEGDVFPGAIFKASQRMDRLVLEHLVASDGMYRLHMTNELDEVQYVDEVKLLVADAPPGIRVVPMRGGRLRALTAPVAPARWTDLAGKEVRLEAGMPWISGPFAGDPQAPAEHRDGLVLAFPRPSAAPSATLIIRAEPNPWASHLMRQVLALQGRSIFSWYAQMERDAGARAEFLGALGREGQLALRVWNGAAWQDLGIVRSHEAVEVPIRAIPGDTLRFRLDSTPGLWSVESAEVDFGPEVPLDVTEVRPAVAEMPRRGDVRGTLRAADERRTVLERGDSIELGFAVPPPAAGRRRTVVLQAAGYYTITVPAEGEPEPALFAKLVRQPGALGRYGRDLLRADVERAMAAAATAGSKVD